MHGILYQRVSPAGLSIGLLACAAIWLVGAWEWYAARAAPDSGPSLSCMLILAVAPVLIFAGAVALAQARRQSRFTWLDRCALAAAGVVGVWGGWLAWVVLSSVRTMGM